MSVKASTFNTIVTVSQIANDGTSSRRAGNDRALPRASVSPNTTMVTTAESPRRSAASHTPKVITNWKMTELGASEICCVTIPTGLAKTHPTTPLPTKVAANAGMASIALKLPAATAPNANR